VEPRDVTILLRQWKSGDRDAFDKLLPIIYHELHRIAGAYVARERGNTYSPTELVSEAYERLVGNLQAPDLNDRVHFYAIAARHMRQILVDRARKRNAAKRGGGERAVTLEEALASDNRPEALVALDDALAALAAVDERKARVVEMHYFAGMTQDDIAAALGVNVRTVVRDLRVAIAWIGNQLQSAE
jgi:RNA polymerase sigma factor (TIGR02999 family)